MKDFRSLRVRQKSHELALAVYGATRGFPCAVRYGLTSQIRRAGVAISANLAGGCGRSGDRELARFVSIAMGSATELEYELLLARDLGYLEEPTHGDLAARVVETKKMLASLLRSLRAEC
jgi:four helix bundle protein